MDSDVISINSSRSLHAGYGGKGLWPFAIVNNKHCGEVKVFQFSDLYDRAADTCKIS